MAEARERQWVVPEDLPDRHPEDVQPVNREEAAQAFLEAEAILQRLGGVMQTASQRVEVADGRFITVGYVFRHVSYAPAQRAPSNGHVEEPEAEPLAEAVEV